MTHISRDIYLFHMKCAPSYESWHTYVEIYLEWVCARAVTRRERCISRAVTRWKRCDVYLEMYIVTRWKRCISRWKRCISRDIYLFHMKCARVTQSQESNDLFLSHIVVCHTKKKNESWHTYLEIYISFIWNVRVSLKVKSQVTQSLNSKSKVKRLVLVTQKQESSHSKSHARLMLLLLLRKT